MKSDFYTKAVLTIIAICLTFITFQNVNVIPKAYASDAINASSGLVKNYGLVPLNNDGSINVKVISSEIDVNIVRISTSDELDVNIDEIGGGYVSYGGPIEVKIK